MMCDRRYWLLTLAAVSALLATFPLAVSEANFGFTICVFSVLIIFVVLIAVNLVVHRGALPDNYLSLVLMAILYVGTIWTLLGGYFCDAIRIRELYRWMLWSNKYGARVLVQLVSSVGD